MRADDFINALNSDFYSGVPDSLLKELCNVLMNKYGIDGKHHIIAANEGNAVALAAGYHLATGKIPVVYMQNSGEGNILNPVASLCNDKVYAIPMIFIIGWRGEPGVKDEPQHIFQGEITLKLLEVMQIDYFIIDKDTDPEEAREWLLKKDNVLKAGRQLAFVVKKDSFSSDSSVKYSNNYSMKREEIIQEVADISGDDLIISTTGKTSRELFEIREKNNENHKRDFLTVGSMGHTSSIALEIALQRKDKKVWILDGDGALLMHLGGMALIGANAPENLVHIVINNEAHETVGGQPTAIKKVNLVDLAKSLGYPETVCVNNIEKLKKALENAKESKKLSFIEVKSAIGSRKDLGRPTIKAVDNKTNFMNELGLEIINAI